MAYTKNPNMPRVRRDAAAMVGKKYTVSQVARRYGVGTSTISKWVRKAAKIGLHPIPTKSSRPKHHPKQLSDELMWRIYHKRLVTKRCAEVIHQELVNEGVRVSLSTVKRVLDRMGLTKKRSPWKRYHLHSLDSLLQIRELISKRFILARAGCPNLDSNPSRSRTKM